MKYERSILVPYLKNLYDLEFVKLALEQKISFYESNINGMQAFINNVDMGRVPEREDIKSAKWDGFSTGLGTGLFGSIFLIVMYYGFYWFFSMFISEKRLMGFRYTMIFVGILSIIIMCVVGIIVCIKEEKERAIEINEQIDKQLIIIQKQRDTAAQYLSMMPEYQQNNVICKGEYKVVKEQLEQAYSLNIIPKQYRDIYCIAYIFEYFSTSDANDLDMIIQTLILDSIQKQLICIQNSIQQVLANQRDLMNQVEGLCSEARMINKKSEQQLKELAKLEKNQEIQNRYFDMIETNTAATMYFSAATCIKALDL